MMAQQLSFDDWNAHQAVAARDVGMATAEFAEALTGSNFGEVAYAAICHVARRQSEVHVDDVLRYLKVRPSQSKFVRGRLASRHPGRHSFENRHRAAVPVRPVEAQAQLSGPPLRPVPWEGRVTPEQYMREALHLFIADPPDSDFQRGYLAGLKVFANEAMGFAWDDPLLIETVNVAVPAAMKPKFTVIQGDKA